MVISNTQMDMTTLPTFLLIVIVLVVLFIGALVGNFTSGVEAKKKLEEARARAEIVAEQARAEVERVTRAAQARPPAAPSLPGRTLLRLWLDDNDRPALDLDGQPVDTVRMPESHQKRLFNLLSAMRPWAESRAAAIPAPGAPPAAAQPAALVSPAARTVPQPPEPVKPVTPSIASILSFVKPGKKEAPPPAPSSIVAQIDEILQARLASATLADRDISLQESPEGGVTVLVGSQQFNSIGEVTDPNIQSEIRAAIAEWEKKYVPGM